MCMAKRLSDDLTASGDIIVQLDLKIATNLAVEGDKSNCNQCTAS